METKSKKGVLIVDPKTAEKDAVQTTGPTASMHYPNCFSPRYVPHLNAQINPQEAPICEYAAVIAETLKLAKDMDALNHLVVKSNYPQEAIVPRVAEFLSVYHNESYKYDYSGRFFWIPVFRFLETSAQIDFAINDMDDWMYPSTVYEDISCFSGRCVLNFETVINNPNQGQMPGWSNIIEYIKEVHDKRSGQWMVTPFNPLGTSGRNYTFKFIGNTPDNLSGNPIRTFDPYDGYRFNTHSVITTDKPRTYQYFFTHSYPEYPNPSQDPTYDQYGSTNSSNLTECSLVSPNGIQGNRFELLHKLQDRIYASIAPFWYFAYNFIGPHFDTYYERTVIDLSDTGYDFDRGGIQLRLERGRVMMVNNQLDDELINGHLDPFNPLVEWSWEELYDPSYDQQTHSNNQLFVFTVVSNPNLTYIELRPVHMNANGEYPVTRTAFFHGMSQASIDALKIQAFNPPSGNYGVGQCNRGFVEEYYVKQYIQQNLSDVFNATGIYDPVD